MESKGTALVKDTETFQSMTATGDNPVNLQEDINLMINFAVDKGLNLPEQLSMQNSGETEKLIKDYNSMLAAIKPANIQSIRYIDSQILGQWKFKKWYQIPIFTKCVIITIISLIVLVSVSLLSIVNDTNQAQGLLESSGYTLFFNLLFICSASLMGVMFFLLKTIGDKIKKYELSPVDAIELDSTILIGVISGFIIAELFTFSIAGFAGDSIEIKKMTLALLGGFSSDAIFTFLESIVKKIKSLFKVA